MNALQNFLPPHITQVQSDAFLSDLDRALALFLDQQQHVADPRARLAHLWLAALTSYQWSRGHACLDLQALVNQPAQTLGLPPTKIQLTQRPFETPANTSRPSTTPLSLDWRQLSDDAVHLPWIQGPHSPLVLSPQRQLYLRRAWQAEQIIRQNLTDRLATQLAVDEQLAHRLDALFGPAHPKEPDLQRQACQTAAMHRVALITGGPGTGKTTTVVRLLALLIDQSTQPLRISLAAPTGKAAARLSESIQKSISHMPESVRALIPNQALTLHRLLTQARPQLSADVVIVDEASMVDLEMMARLLQAVPLSARLILLGDKDQLASVEAGAVMAQLCSGALVREQTVTLLKSRRFDPHSGIGQWARAVNEETSDKIKTQTLQDLWENTPKGLLHDSARVTRVAYASHPQSTQWAEDLRQGWHTWLTSLTPHRQAQPCTDAQAHDLLQQFSEFCVLCALRSGPFGVEQLNQSIQTALGLDRTHVPMPERLPSWYIGRPVMVTRNDYGLGLMNGDIGLCLPDASGRLKVAFDVGGQIRWVACARLDSVETVFAMTVHKSQGSEFRHVLLVVPDQDAPILTRELIYTGITRASERLTLWAREPEILFQACCRKVLRSGGLAWPDA